MEIDFLLRHNGKCTPLEVKVNTGRTKSMTTVLKNQEVYHLAEGLKLGNYNVGRSGNILTLPLYMGFLLREDSDLF